MGHRCPPWCHKCPDLIAIVAERGGDTTDPDEITMPGCMGTAALMACCCEALTGTKSRTSVASRSQKLALLRDLVCQYPLQARQIVADLAPPRETEHPRLEAVR